MSEKVRSKPKPVYHRDRSIGYRRVARKRHEACGGYCPPIQPGDVYLECLDLPGSDAGYATSAGHPVRMAVCAPCAVRHTSLDPIPYDQLCRQGLL